MDPVINFYPTLGTCCVVLSSCIAACAACAGGWRLFKHVAEDKSERATEINKQIADLKTALRRKNRLDHRMSQKCQRLERRVEQLENTVNGEKT